MIGLLYRAADRIRRRVLRGDSGRVGEDLAHRYLRAKGCVIVARNYRPRGGAGEIDLVVWHGGKLVFVEVKTRLTAAFGEPESAVNELKRVRLRHVAMNYAMRAGVEWARTRFDVVSIVLDPLVRIEWWRDAFR